VENQRGFKVRTRLTAWHYKNQILHTWYAMLALIMPAVCLIE